MKRIWLILSLVLSTAGFAVDFGVRDSGNLWPDVVALTQKTHSSTYQIFCSGVVIHPQVILTAAHCLQDGGIRVSSSALRAKVKGLRVYFGEGSEDSTVNKNLFEVQRAIIHPAYLRDIRGQADLALLILKKEAPIAKENIRPLALASDLLKHRIRRGAELSVMGFGYSEQLGSSAFAATTETFGVKHIGKVKIEGKTADEIQIVPGAPIDRFGLYRSSPREGDSGGPAFFHDSDGTTYLTGVVSRATKFNHGPRGVAYSQVRNWVCWMEKESGFRLRPEDGTPDYCEMEQPSFDQSLFEQNDFLSLCQNPRGISEAYTLHVLHALLKAPTCLDLEYKLTQTTNLNLDATYINDLGIFASLPHLQRLSVRDNLIQSVYPLQKHFSLGFLDISYNNVKDAPFLKELEKDSLWLVGKSRQYHNIGRTNFIRLCGADQTSELAQKTIKAIMEMFNMRSSECVNANYELIRMRQLSFYQHADLSDMSPLIGLHTLEEIDLKNQKVSSLDFILGIDDLQKLILDANPITDLSPLLQHRNLKELSVQNMGLSDLKIISELPRLRVLHLAGNRIKDFSALKERMDKGILKVTGLDQQLAD